MRIFRNRLMLGGLCLVLALLVSFVLVPFTNAAATQKTNVVRATKLIKVGEQLTADNVKSVEVGLFGLPQAAVKKAEDAIGQYATADIYPDETLLITKIAEQPTIPENFLKTKDVDTLAVAITIKGLANGVSGKLQKGDIISIIAPSSQNGAAAEIPPMLKYLEVLATTTKSGGDAENQSEELATTVIVAANIEQAKLLASLEMQSKIYIALVYRGDTQTAQMLLAEQKQVIETLTAPPEIEQTEEADDGEND